MFVADCLSVNSQGHLTIGGADTVVLAQRYGTPLYVMDEGQIRENCRAYKRSIEHFYGGNGLVAYAGKAFCCKEICRVMMEEGLGIDVVSGGELFTAQSVGFPAEKIVFHGNNKTVPELTEAVQYNVGRIVVDNLAELTTLNSIAAAAGRQVGVLLRIKPGVDAHTHDFVRTGQIDSKFGFALETGEALEAVRYALTHENLKLRGVHCHIGSQIFDVDPFELAAQVMLGFMSQIKAELGVELAELNLGGGFGIKYVAENDPVPFERYMEKVSGVVKDCCGRLGLRMPFILLEPGRSIVGAAGVTLYTVGAVKEIPGVRTYVSVDGGMTDNPRYALYQSAYEATVANRANEQRDQLVTLAGRCCESGDLLGEGMALQKPKPGDLVAVFSTGAYNYSMASNYNRVPRPPVVFVRKGSDRLVVRRETFQDLISCDL